MGDVLKIIDEHAHIAGRGDIYKQDLFWSKLFENGIGFQALKILKGWSFKKVGDELMVNTLLKQANEANHVDYVTVLAFDNVYDLNGKGWGPFDTDENQIRSTLYVSNSFVANLCQNNPKILLGISVHPYRNDALDELEKYKEKAVLCKLMPSAHWIDLDNPNANSKLDKFYLKLAEIKLPLLLHSGVETSIPSSDKDKKYNKYDNPFYIERALDLGVTVILAHCGCSYFDILEDNFVSEALKLFEKQRTIKPNWKLYADISALFSPFRRRDILDTIFQKVPASKLIYGSDFPNPAKGRKEFFLRPFLRFSKTNLINRYYKITLKWLAKYYSTADTLYILTNFHRLLNELGREI
jgi:predicted TIM-barrel fold metal-dependent hydrolase